MENSQWYYVDRAGQQVGPVEVGALRAAYARNEIDDASLAWRDGMAAWQPISQLSAELGITPMAPAAPLPPAWAAPAAAASDNDPYRTPNAFSGEGDFVGEGEVVHAGFWRRWAALFLDQLIITIPLLSVFMVVMFAVGFGSMAAGGSEPNPGLMIVLQLGYYVVWFGVAIAYYAGLESGEAQATFGKRALGIKVTDLEGRRLSFKHALGRWFAASLSYMSMYIGFLMAGFTERKQALHDYVAGTYVVDKWAYTSFPERQQRGFSGCLIVFMVVTIGSLLLIPIFFVIAISAFEDFNRRARSASLDEPTSATIWVMPSVTKPSPYL